ncbi:hypothetical protein AG1IA_08819 [Rhizoctonia solani AG-1 IA]|uniref:Uncharacterized protein n=1 Tax=Thanatephorus cucumeris (strain AG1-IA) TaxID=983506 RepID=L8WG32_THACA|nr:hypothetical protein AG1IA_08819 [Rhizoctonia solani AG-1 IA]
MGPIEFRGTFGLLLTFPDEEHLAAAAQKMNTRITWPRCIWSTPVECYRPSSVFHIDHHEVFPVTRVCLWGRLN